MIIQRLLLASLIAAVTWAGAPPVALQEFEGRWIIDKKNSPSAEFAPEGLVQEIKIHGETITIKSKFEPPKNGIFPIFWAGLTLDQLNLSADGAAEESMVGPFKYEFKTLRDGNELYTDYRGVMDNAGQQGWLKGHWVHRLSEDGKWMWLQLDGTCSDGRSIKATLLFHRK